MKVVAIVQARMGSSRLSGKVLKALGSTTVLGFLIERIKESTLVDEIVIATSKMKCDDQIVTAFKDSNYKIFRGSENDVLSRYIDAALDSKADVIVRITGDCPLVDPVLVDDCVKKLIDQKLDYISNCNQVDCPLPDGFDVEVFTTTSFRIIDTISIISAYREHVTFGYFKTGLFDIGTVEYEQPYSDLRLTLDYEEDYLVISKIVEAMNSSFWGWEKISKFLYAKKSISNLNSHIIRNASWEKSFDIEDESRKLLLDRDECIAHGSGLLSKRADQFSPHGWPKNYIKAKGQVIWAENDRLFLDYSIGGIGATTLGYAFDFVDDQVVQAIRNGSATSLNSGLEIIATQKLLNVIPWADSVRYTRSGGEATTLAIRIARAKTKQTKILFSGYHGWHDWYLSSAINHKLGNHLLDDLPIAGVPRELAGTALPFDYGNTESFISKLEKNKADLAAVILEPMRYSSPDKEFLSTVRAACNKHNIILIFDEISSGFRFNNNAVHLDGSVNPDIVVFSKALGNGYPIAAIAGKNWVMDAAAESFISSTTHTEAIGFAAMSAVLDFYSTNDVSSSLKNRGSAIKKILLNSAKANGLDIKIVGMDQLWSWSFNCDPILNRQLQTIVTEKMLEKSLLFSNRFYATLGIDSELYSIFENSLLSVFEEIKLILINKDDPKKHIKFGLNKLGNY